MFAPDFAIMYTISKNYLMGPSLHSSRNPIFVILRNCSTFSLSFSHILIEYIDFFRHLYLSMICNYFEITIQ